MKQNLLQKGIIVTMIVLFASLSIIPLSGGNVKIRSFQKGDNYLTNINGSNEKNSINDFNLMDFYHVKMLPDYELLSRWTLWKEFPGRYEPFFDVVDVVDFGQTAWGLTTADFNSDSFLDFAVSWSPAPWTQSTISIMFNDGEGKFTQEDVYTITEPLYCYIDDLDSGDYDNDGDIDFIFTYSDRWGSDGNGTVALLVNDGANDFGDCIIANLTPTSETARINPQVSSADYDRDGDIDFLVGDNSGLVEFYKNDGTGSFSSSCISDFGGWCSWGVSSADFDGDGDIDFIVSVQKSILLGEGYIYVKWNDGSQSCFNHSDFMKIADLPPKESFFTGVIMAFGCLFTMDYNDDGLMDFFFSGGDSVFLYIQKETGVFEYFTVCRLPSPKAEDDFWDWYLDDVRKGGMASGDFDGDNVEDLVIGGVQGVVRLFYNNQVLVDIVHPDRYCLIQNNVINKMMLPHIRCFLKHGTSLVFGDLIVQAKPLEDLSKVEFYLNGRLVHTDESEPFEWNWDRFSFGIYKIKAVAYDLDGDNAGFDDSYILKFI